jgi:hypothetical protein
VLRAFISVLCLVPIAESTKIYSNHQIFVMYFKFFFYIFMVMFLLFLQNRFVGSCLLDSYFALILSSRVVYGLNLLVDKIVTGYFLDPFLPTRVGNRAFSGKSYCNVFAWKIVIEGIISRVESRIIFMRLRIQIQILMWL